MSTQAADSFDAHRGKRELWGHPRELWMLLSVTTGFNFAFYGFRAYLAPYIAQAFYAGLGTAPAQRQADLLTSGLLALMYATPILGGYVADRVLGQVRSLALSLWLAVPSLLLMSLPSLPGFEMGAALLALSVGLSIPLTVLIGRNYDKDDPRREGGYTWFYLAINLAAFLAPFVCADFVGRRFGYRWGFIAAAAGMTCAAVILQLRSRKLRAALPGSDPPQGGRAVLWVTGAIAALLYPTARLLSAPQASSIRRDRVQIHRYLAPWSVSWPRRRRPRLPWVGGFSATHSPISSPARSRRSRPAGPGALKPASPRTPMSTRCSSPSAGVRVLSTYSLHLTSES